MNDIDLSSRLSCRKVLVVSLPRKGKTTLVKKILDMYRGTGLSCFYTGTVDENGGIDCLNTSSESFYSNKESRIIATQGIDLDGYNLVRPVGNRGICVNILILDSVLHGINFVDFDAVFKRYELDVENLLIITIDGHSIPDNIGAKFDVTIDLNKESMEEACKKLERGVTMLTKKARDLLDSCNFKRVLIHGSVAKNRQDMVKKILDIHRGLNLSCYLVSEDASSAIDKIDLTGYSYPTSTSGSLAKVNFIFAETTQPVENIDFVTLLASFKSEVITALIVTCVGSNSFNINLDDFFDDVINLDKEAIEDACKRI